MKRIALLLSLLLLASPAYAGLKAVTTSSSGGAVSSLTTTGTSGASTLVTGVLNIPVYSNGSSGLSIGTTTITGGTNTYIEYNNSGVLGEYAVTGTGTTAVLSTSPTFTTSITDPLVIGGTGAASTLTLESTSGSGTTDSIIFKTASQATAMTVTTGGILNIASGSKGIQFNGQNGLTLPANDSGGASIAIGSSALGSAPASAAYDAVAIGYQALSSASLTTAATTNTAVGYQALLGNTSGAENTAVGYQACSASTTGVENTCIGKGSSVGTNTQATAIGQGTVVSGTQGTAMGWHAQAAANAFAAGPGANASGTDSISFGNATVASAQYGIAIGNIAKNGGTNDISIGQNAGYGGGGGITGNNDIYIGYNVGSTAGSGSNNVAIGYGVGSTQLASTANFNILIGTNSGVDLGTNTASGTLDIGNVIYGTGLGTSGSSPAGAVGIGTATIVDSAELAVQGTILQTTEKSCSTGLTTDSQGAINGCVASDPSLKHGIQALTFDPKIFDQIQPISYYWNDAEKYDANQHFGFNARQVYGVAPQLTKPAGTGLLGIDNSGMEAVLFLELKNQQQEIDQLRAMKGLPPRRCNLLCRWREWLEGQ